MFADPSLSKQALNAAVAHGPQNLSGGILNIVFYKIWYESLYGELAGKVRLKAQIHDSVFYGYRGEGTPDLVKKYMTHAIQVKDFNRVERTMLIPPDMNSGEKYWADLK
jgi:hypothetical protein